MRKINLKIVNPIILNAMVIFNAIMFAAGVLLPPERNFYLPYIIDKIIIIFTMIFMFITPVICLIGGIYAIIWITIEPKGYKRKYIIWLLLFIIELLVWYLSFMVLISV